MSISKTIGIVTGAIPVMGLLVGGVTYGVTFKTTVEELETKTVKQGQINKNVEEWFSSIPDTYDDTAVFHSIDSISNELHTLDIPEPYDDTYLSDRIQQLDIDLVELRTRLENFDLGEIYDDSDLRRRLVELEGSINSLSTMDVDSSGDIDMRSVLVQVASIDGTIQGIRSTLNSLDNKITSAKSDIRTLQNQVSTLERSKGGGSSTSVQRYDDTSVKSDIRDLNSDIRTLKTQMSGISSSAGSGSTKTIENDYDDSNIRNDIRQLQNDLSTLKRNSTSYDDSSLQRSITTIKSDLSIVQSTLNSLSSQEVNDPRVDNLLNDIYQIKEDVGNRIHQLEMHVNSFDTNSGLHEFKEQLYEDMSYTVEDIYFQIEDTRNIVWDLQESIKELSYSNTTTSNNNQYNNDNNQYIDNYILEVKHKETSYTGTYYVDHYYNGKPVWVNYECDQPGSKFEKCFIFEYKPEMWVIQPLAPSTEWLANAYTYAEWPWEGSWDGDVKRINVIK